MKLLIAITLIALCAQNLNGSHPGSDKCTQGPDYWCANLENARECDMVSYCKDNVWYGDTPKAIVGANRCTWGPDYWCKSLDTARECNVLEHCQKEVWHGPAPK